MASFVAILLAVAALRYGITAAKRERTWVRVLRIQLFDQSCVSKAPMLVAEWSGKKNRLTKITRAVMSETRPRWLKEPKLVQEKGRAANVGYQIYEARESYALEPPDQPIGAIWRDIILS